MEKGEYIRIGGKIDKIKYIEDITNIIHGEKGNYVFTETIDHSFRLIDLVHLGDLVNNEVVIGINYTDGDYVDSIYTNTFIFEEDIKTITGKEFIDIGTYTVRKDDKYEEN